MRPDNARKTNPRLSKMVKKTEPCTGFEEGPTAAILTHGEVEINLPKVGRRGPIIAKRVGLHDRLYARGKLTDADWDWARRYVREYEIASGGRPDRPECESGEPYHGPLIYNRQCAAVGFLRRAHERITAQERLVLIAACVECALVVDLGPLLGLRPKSGEPDVNYVRRVESRVNSACVRIIRQACGVGQK